MGKKVIIIYRNIPQYRAKFYWQLIISLKSFGIDLDIVYGKSINDLKKDEVDLKQGIFIQNRYFSFFGLELIWQPCLKYTKNADLVIVEQANKLLINYILILKRKRLMHIDSRTKLAFWGHGRNFQGNRNSLKEKIKKSMIDKCDWWFAYTQGVKDYLIKNKYPEEKITVVQNAIDTVWSRREYNKVSLEEIDTAKKKLNIESENTGIYCGGIYSQKRIDFLLNSADLIKKTIKDFNLIIIGAGPESRKIEYAASERPWLHYLGPKFNVDKIPYFKMAKIHLMPGLVGLAILDSFALRTPLITTGIPSHSPEIEYLENYKNGIITEDSLVLYSKAVIEVLSNENLYEKLLKGCDISYKKYTLEKMVDNFSKGILDCLKN